MAGKLVFKNSSYKLCSKNTSAKITLNLEDQIKKYLQGEWKVKYQDRAGTKSNISNGRNGLPDLTFINKDHAKIRLKKEVRPVYYEIKDDNIVLKTEQPNPLKVHLIEEKEMQVSFELKPESGVFIYYKFGGEK